MKSNSDSCISTSCVINSDEKQRMEQKAKQGREKIENRIKEAEAIEKERNA